MVPLVGAFFAAPFFMRAEGVQQNILRREIQSTTLSPGRATHGFLYIPVPKKRVRDNIRLLIPLTPVDTREPIIISVTL